HAGGTVEHRLVGEVEALLPQLLDLVDDEARLVVLVLGLVAGDGKTPAPVGPEVLRRSLGVLGDHRVGGVEDGLGGPVVLLEDDDTASGKSFSKSRMLRMSAPRN